jgi:hypothetical protein
VDVCLACGSADPSLLLDLGQVPVQCTAMFASAEEARRAESGPIRLTLCATCGATTNADFEPDLVVYDGDYENSQLFSRVFRTYAEGLVSRLVDDHGIRDSTVVEIGSGKGEFLAMVAAAGGNRAVGYDPTYGGEADHLDPGLDITFVRDLFDETTVAEPPDLVCCRHVLEHLADPLAMLRRVRRAVDANPGCVLYLEVPNAEFTFTDSGVWDIIYQHCTYFSAVALERVVRAAGFDVVSLEASFGGQFLSLDAVPAAGRLPDLGPGVAGMSTIDGELAAEVRGTVERIAPFGARHQEAMRTWRDRLAAWSGEGRTVALWGAGAKGVTFLNVVAGDQVSAVVDLNVRKHGTHLAGTGHLVLAPEELPDVHPDVVVVMNALYVDEIRADLAKLGIAAEVVAV